MSEERRKKVIDPCKADVKEDFRKLRSIDDISAFGGLRRAVSLRIPDLTDAEYFEAEYVVIARLGGDADCYSTLASVAERHGQWRGESARHLAERAAEAGDVEAIALLSKLIKASFHMTFPQPLSSSDQSLAVADITHRQSSGTSRRRETKLLQTADLEQKT